MPAKKNHKLIRFRKANEATLLKMVTQSVNVTASINEGEVEGYETHMALFAQMILDDIVFDKPGLRQPANFVEDDNKPKVVAIAGR